MDFLDIHTHAQKSHSIFNWMLDGDFPMRPCSVGVHPWELSEKNWKRVEQFVSKQNVIFIGETGLDFACSVDREKQRFFFKRHIELAESIQKPLILHCVKAYSDCLSELKNFSGKIIFHDFNGGEEVAIQILKRDNVYLSLGNTLFRENSKVIPYLKLIPLNRIFFETDDSSRTIGRVYEQYSDLTGADLNHVSQQVVLNFNNI